MGLGGGSEAYAQEERGDEIRTDGGMELFHMGRDEPAGEIFPQRNLRLDKAVKRFADFELL
jgi:hypothetical protein